MCNLDLIWTKLLFIVCWNLDERQFIIFYSQNEMQNKNTEDFIILPIEKIFFWPVFNFAST